MKRSIIPAFGVIALAAAAFAGSLKANEPVYETSASYDGWTYYLQGDANYAGANGGTAWSTTAAGTRVFADNAGNRGKAEGIYLSGGMEFEIVAKKEETLEYHHELGQDGRGFLHIYGSHYKVNDGVSGYFDFYYGTDGYLYPVLTNSEKNFYFTKSFWDENRNLHGWYPTGGGGATNTLGDYPGTPIQTLVAAGSLANYAIEGVTYSGSQVYAIPTTLNGSCLFLVNKNGDADKGPDYSVFQDHFFVGGSSSDYGNALGALNFVLDYMAMDSTTANQCETLYPEAKKAYEKLDGAVQTIVQNQFADAYARYVAWGVAYNAAHPASSALVIGAMNSEGSKTTIAVAATCLVATAALGGVLFIRKRKNF